MSVDYAAGLSYYPNKGKCGQREYIDSEDALSEKVAQLSNLVLRSKHCVVLTGAGISTSCGIPDFRGPQGVWTLEEKGLSAQFNTTFDDAKFSIGHLALVALERAGLVKYLITQNVDGLHLRSGFPRDRLAILHGDMFIEQCDKCRHQYLRRSSVKTIGQKYTGSSCTTTTRRDTKCRGRLKDTVLDWEDSLPNDEMDNAVEHSRNSDLFLVLGSSLRILPAGNLPLQCKKNGGKLITVNLQKTKHHSKADLVIHGHIDLVMEKLCASLGVNIPCKTSPSICLQSMHVDLRSNPHSNITVDKDLISGCVKSEQDSTYEDIIDLKPLAGFKRKTDANELYKAVKVKNKS